jgi:hypothetical protein
MSNPNKLFKCYKDGCSFRQDHDDGPFLTQSEYDVYVKDGSLVCPEDNLNCGLQELKAEDYPKPPGFLINKKLAAIVGIAVCVCIATVFAIRNFRKELPKIEKVEQKVAPVETPQTSNETETMEPIVTEPEPTITTPESPSTNISFSALFQKIGDSKIPYSEKDALKNQLIENYFKNDAAQVIEIGKNNTEVDHTTIKDFLEELSQQNYSIEILEVIPKSQKKIKTIKIRQN